MTKKHATALVLFLLCAAAVVWTLFGLMEKPIMTGVSTESGRNLGPADKTGAPPIVLTGHAATWALARELTRGTPIEIQSAWPSGLPWREQTEFAHAAPSEWIERVKRAAAVITVRDAVPTDALYAAVRAHHLGVIELDVSVAPDQRTPVLPRKAGESPDSPHFFTSPSQTARVAARLAEELDRLHTDAQPVIAENLRQLQARLLRLRAEWAHQAAEVGDPGVILVGEMFAPLLADLGIAAELTVPDGTTPLTDAQRATLTREIEQRGLKISVHAWPPQPAEATFWQEQGIDLVILDAHAVHPERPSVYFDSLQRNGEQVLAALRRTEH